MPFGQYQGWDMNDIPLNYLFWLSEEGNLRAWFKYQVEEIINQRCEAQDRQGDSMLTKEDRQRLVVLTTDDLARWWDYYAKVFKNEFYGAELVMPHFVIERSRRFMGYWSPSERKIMLNNHYIFPQDRFENVLIHEMCHQYVTDMNIIDSSPHGRKWRNIAARMSVATDNVITICDERIYAPNRYYQKGQLVVLPSKPIVRPTKDEKKKLSVQEIEDSYEGVNEDLANM